MANKLILDFETNMITWDTDSQKGTEYCDGLAERREAILQAMGYETVDLTPAIKIINAFANGEIKREEMVKRLDEFTEK